MRTIITLTASIILSGYSLIAQTWTQYQSSDTNITYSSVKDMTFDISNNIWMATDRGIIKFDGSTWTQFLHNDTNMNNHCNQICASSKNNDIWLAYYGTYLGGYQTSILSKFDGSTWTKYTPSNSNIPFIPTGVTNIDFDSAGTVWVSCSEGILTYNGSTWSQYDSTDFNTGISIANCVIDPNTNTPWALVTSNTGIPAHMELNGSTWTKHNNNNEMLYTLGANAVNIIIDGLGDQYIECWWNDDLYKYSPQSNQYDSINLNNLGTSASRVYSDNNLSYIPKADSILVYNWNTKAIKGYSDPSLAGQLGLRIYGDNNGAKWIVKLGQSFSLIKFDDSSVGINELGNTNIQTKVYPNPFSDQFNTKITISENGYVNVGIYNMLGALVETIHSGTLTAGTHQLQHRSDLPSGMYMLRVETQNGISTQQLVKSF